MLNLSGVVSLPLNLASRMLWIDVKLFLNWWFYFIRYSSTVMVFGPELLLSPCPSTRVFVISDVSAVHSEGVILHVKLMKSDTLSDFSSIQRKDNFHMFVIITKWIKLSEDKIMNIKIQYLWSITLSLKSRVSKMEKPNLLQLNLDLRPT